MNNDSNVNVGLIIGLVIGAAVGAVVGLLVAPASGEETRRKLGETARRLGDEGKKKLDEARHFAGERADEVRGAVRAGKDAYQQARAEHQISREPGMGS